MKNMAVWGLMVLGAVSGCQHDGFGESVDLPPAQQASLLAAFASGQPLTLPGDTAFNLADSQRNATAIGQADSIAESTGQARCTAEAKGVGTAEAQFQLGHVLDNRGQEPLAVTARFVVDYQASVQCDQEDVTKPADHLGLRIFIRNSDGGIEAELALTEVSPFVGPKQWSAQQTQAFDVTLQPHLAYYFVLAGRTAVTGTEANPTSAEIEVRSLSVELTPHR